MMIDPFRDPGRGIYMYMSLYEKIQELRSTYGLDLKSDENV